MGSGPPGPARVGKAGEPQRLGPRLERGSGRPSSARAATEKTGPPSGKIPASWAGDSPVDGAGPAFPAGKTTKMPEAFHASMNGRSKSEQGPSSWDHALTR